MCLTAWALVTDCGETLLISCVANIGTPSGHTRQQKDVVGKRCFNSENLHSDLGKQFSAISFIEDMVVKAAICEIIKRS